MQGYALAEPGCPWPLTFISGWPQNIRFFIEIQCWEPWILEVQSPGPPSMFCNAQPWTEGLFSHMHTNGIFIVPYCSFYSKGHLKEK